MKKLLMFVVLFIVWAVLVWPIGLILLMVIFGPSLLLSAIWTLISFGWIFKIVSDAD